MTSTKRDEPTAALADRDATLARARAEEALRESEERYHSLVESLDEGFAVCECVRDADGRVCDYRFLELNSAWEALTGWTREAMLGRLSSELMPACENDFWIRTYEQLVETGEPARVERFVERVHRWFDVRAFSRGGDRFAVLHNDITARKHAEQTLQGSEGRQAFLLALSDRLRSLADPRTIMNATAEMLGRHLNVSSVHYRLYEPDGDTSMRAATYSDGRLATAAGNAPFRLSQGAPGWAAALRAGQEIFSDDVENDPRGLVIGARREFLMRGSAAVPLIKDDRLVAVLTIAHAEPRRWSEAEKQLCRDIAERTWAAIERARAESALRFSEEKMRLAMEAATMVHWTVDVATGNTAWSANYADIMGFPAEPTPTHVLDRTANQTVPEDMHLVLDAMNKTMRGEGEMHIEYRMRIPRTGDLIWLETHATRIVDATTGAAQVVGVARNITKRKRAEEERARLLDESQSARRQAEHAMTVRDEFLAVVSHELRTPLSAILIWAKMLRAGAVPSGDQTQALAVIEQSALAQRQLIDDLLDVARTISGNLRVQLEDAELGPVLAAAVEAVRPMAEAKCVALTMDLGKTAVWSRIDRARLQQVVWNLANNAVKFTPSGGRVAVRFMQLDSALRIEVEDNGAGIAPSFLPYVFERFRQADSSTTRRHGGLGLGLAIARQLVELHGGTIEAKSAGEAQGATFVVELPRIEIDAPVSAGRRSEVRAAVTSEPFVPGPFLTGVRVLFVEDEAQTRAVMQWLLEQCGAQVTPAGSAGEALKAFDAAGFDATDNPDVAIDKRRFDVLVSDVGLPETDGYELLAELRRRAGGVGLPALALTAYARDEDRQRAIDAGFGAYLAKPVEPRVLIETIVGMVGR
jgi:PAS domain S-box-containing protein